MGSEENVDGVGVVAVESEMFRMEQVIEYVAEIEENEDPYLQFLLQHKRISGVYWALTSLHLLNAQHRAPVEKIFDYVHSCYDEESGGFGGHPEQDPHILYTLSALQILALLGRLDSVDTDQVMQFVCKRQNQDGSFSGDEISGEIDTRFSYAGLLCARLLGRIADIDVKSAVKYVIKCANFDGGFGCFPGTESHAGQVFCCVGTLALADAVDRIPAPRALGWWLCQRQLPCGGFNGRPDKLEDVCYSWWVLSSLHMIDRAHWIDSQKLCDFIVSAQDSQTGGIADRPGHRPDIFHTYFGLAGLSLLNFPNLASIDPAFALPTDVVRSLNSPAANVDWSEG